MIKPQDKRPDVSLNVWLPAALKDRLDAYAKELEDSEIQYVVRSILEEAIPQSNGNGKKTRKAHA